MKKYKIKTEWKKIGRAPVYQNRNGSRIHISGLLRYRDGTTIKIGNCCMSQDFTRLYKVFGFCNRRTLMFIAEIMGA